MDAEEVCPLRVHDVVELRGIVTEVDLDGVSGQVRIDLGRGVSPVWVPVRRVRLVPLPEFAAELGNVSPEPEPEPEPVGAWVGEGGHCGGGVYGCGGPVSPCSLEWRHDGECEA